MQLIPITSLLTLLCYFPLFSGSFTLTNTAQTKKSFVTQSELESIDNREPLRIYDSYTLNGSFTLNQGAHFYYTLNGDITQEFYTTGDEEKNSDYFSVSGFNLAFENLENEKPYSLEMGDLSISLTDATLQKPLKATQFEIASQVNSTYSHALLLFSGFQNRALLEYSPDSGFYTPLQPEEANYHGASYSAVHSRLGNINLNYVYNNYTNPTTYLDTFIDTMFIGDDTIESTSIANRYDTLQHHQSSASVAGVHPINLLGYKPEISWEYAMLFGEYLNEESAIHSSNVPSAFYISLDLDSILPFHIYYDLEVNGEHYNPNGASLQSDIMKNSLKMKKRFSHQYQLGSTFTWNDKYRSSQLGKRDNAYHVSFSGPLLQKRLSNLTFQSTVGLNTKSEEVNESKELYFHLGNSVQKKINNSLRVSLSNRINNRSLPTSPEVEQKKGSTELGLLFTNLSLGNTAIQAAVSTGYRYENSDVAEIKEGFGLLTTELGWRVQQLRLSYALNGQNESSFSSYDIFQTLQVDYAIKIRKHNIRCSYLHNNNRSRHQKGVGNELSLSYDFQLHKE